VCVCVCVCVCVLDFARVSLRLHPLFIKAFLQKACSPGRRQASTTHMKKLLHVRAVAQLVHGADRLGLIAVRDSLTS
jgi:hypothetical protein